MGLVLILEQNDEKMERSHLPKTKGVASVIVGVWCCWLLT